MAGVFLNRKNVILLLMCIELMLLAVNFNFVAFSRYLGDINGQMFVFFILTVAAAESAIGLAILVVLFRERRSIDVEDLDTLQGLSAQAHECRPCCLPIALLPLVAAIIAGLGGRVIGRAGAHSVTIAGGGALLRAVAVGAEADLLGRRAGLRRHGLHLAGQRRHAHARSAS